MTGTPPMRHEPVNPPTISANAPSTIGRKRTSSPWTSNTPPETTAESNPRSHSAYLELTLSMPFCRIRYHRGAESDQDSRRILDGILKRGRMRLGLASGRPGSNIHHHCDPTMDRTHIH